MAALEEARTLLLAVEDGNVTFLWKDYADGSQTKVMTPAATEFIRRFLLHILPAGFVRIRQYVSSRTAREKKSLRCAECC